MPAANVSPNLARALAEGFATLTGDGKNQKITYVAIEHTERFADPEEKVRAEFWAELIFRYGYRAERIGIEVPVPDRKPNISADLVIFRDDERKDPYAVVEFKSNSATDAERLQAFEQACGYRGNLTAVFAGVVAGGTRHFLSFEKHKAGERTKNIIADLPERYGKPPPHRFYRGRAGHDLAAVSSEDLISAIEKCHQTLWEGGKRSPIVAFGEFCKLVFVKIRDEITTKRGEPYQFQTKTDEQPKHLAARIRGLYANEREKEPDVFTETINVDDAIIAQVVAHLEAISLKNTDLDTKGVAFERFLDDFFKGDFGQYFTPRQLIEFTVQMMAPRADDLVLDLACGSGGFLLHALDYVRREADQLYPAHETDPEQAIEHRGHWHDFAKDRLFGIEINDEIARVAKMNMIIHDDGHTNVIGHDALEPFPAIQAKNLRFAPGKFTLVLTNPPFGAVVKKTEKPYLELFELSRYSAKATTGTAPDERADMEHNATAGKKALKQRDSVKTEILFCERVWQFLKPGTGRTAIVLPDSILTNSSLQPVRDWLLAHFQLLAVVSLPQFAFAHFGANVKASIVFLRKLGVAEAPAENQPVFMAAPRLIGYDAKGQSTGSDFPAVVDGYRRFQGDAESYLGRRPPRDQLQVFAETPASFLGRRIYCNQHTVDLLSLLDRWRKSPWRRAGSLREYVEVNPSTLVPDFTLGDMVSFLPMEAVEPMSGEYRVKEVPYAAVTKGYTVFAEGDLLWAKITPCMQNGKAAVVRGLKRRVGFGSTEFHVLRPKTDEIKVEFLWAVLTSEFFLRAAQAAFTGSAGQQRVPADFLENLPLPIPPIAQQVALVRTIESARKQRVMALEKIESEWLDSRRHFEQQLFSGKP